MTAYERERSRMMGEKVRDWLYADDWHWFAVFVVVQVVSVSAFLWFAVWVSGYAKLRGWV